ncbi:hypothetical protein [Calothrix sp. NIES-2098]|nr:hypothetical protein NIES2098_51980 [Calothrix sp. NIES-2098]
MGGDLYDCWVDSAETSKTDSICHRQMLMSQHLDNWLIACVLPEEF